MTSKSRRAVWPIPASQGMPSRISAIWLSRHRALFCTSGDSESNSMDGPAIRRCDIAVEGCKPVRNSVQLDVIAKQNGSCAHDEPLSGTVESKRRSLSPRSVDASASRAGETGVARR